MADIQNNPEYEALFNNVIATYEASKRDARENGVLEQIRAENERAAELARELKSENAKRESMLAALADQKAENDRAERLLEERAQQEAREEARRQEELRQKRIDKIREVRRARRGIIHGLRNKANQIAELYPDAWAELPVDHFVLDNANPNDDSLPVNFMTTHPEYQEWRASPAYDEFIARVRSGEEAEIDDSIDF